MLTSMLRRLIFPSLVLVAACGSDASDPVDPDPPDPVDPGGPNGDPSGDGTFTISFPVSNLPEDVLTGEEPDDLIFSGTNCDGNSSARLNTDTGAITGCNGLVSDTHYRYVKTMQEDGSEIGVFVTRNLRINTAFNVEVEGQLPLVVVASENVEIHGALDAAARFVDGIAGGFSGRKNEWGPGFGPGAGTVGATGGGGGGSYCGIGGDGTGGGAGGPAYGSAEVVPLIGGSSGGINNIWDSGAGGGAVQIVAGTSVSVASTGTINVGGGGGGQGGGGGGSGGALLIETPTATIAGAIAANGGGGGTGSGDVRGQNGLPSDEPALGGAPGSDNVPGGNGSAGEEQNGGHGVPHPIVASRGSGGGGGAGRIRINTMSGAATIAGIVSPAPATGCVTEGAL